MIAGLSSPARNALDAMMLDGMTEFIKLCGFVFFHQNMSSACSSECDILVSSPKQADLGFNVCKFRACYQSLLPSAGDEP